MSDGTYGCDAIAVEVCLVWLVWRHIQALGSHLVLEASDRLPLLTVKQRILQYNRSMCIRLSIEE